MSYPLAFALNYAAELAVLLLCLGGRHWMRVALLCLFLNVCTHPLFWWAFPQVPGSYWPKLLGGEALVLMLELSLGMLFFRAHFSRCRVALAIVAANAVTFLMTFLL